MCGIAGFIGKTEYTKDKTGVRSLREARGVLLDSLQRLEYRGYDSAGIALFDALGIRVIKESGGLDVLRALVASETSVEEHFSCGIGHTRWATHGEPSKRNSHPHITRDGKIAIVHNGIIENHKELKRLLVEKGYEFASDTDTEVALNLIHSLYNGDELDAITGAMRMIKGSYAFAIMFSERKNEIFVARNESPLAVSFDNGEAYVASDALSILPYTKKILYLENHEIANLSREGIKLYSLSESGFEKISREPKILDYDEDSADKGAFPHFMLKEIYEQPSAVKRAINAYDLQREFFGGVERVVMTACGSAYHVCHVAKSVLEALTGVIAEVDIASELRYRRPRLFPSDLVIVVSQSGETADTLAALRYAKESGARTLAIVNAKGSSIAREAERVLYTHAGAEIAVATTKAYSAQLAVIYKIMVELALSRKDISEEKGRALTEEINKIPDYITECLSFDVSMLDLAKEYKGVRDAYFIGRGSDYSAALEGSLKLKEISYIHSEAYAAGELKHGTMSLIENGTLVFVLATKRSLYEKTASNSEECRSRGAHIIALTKSDCHLFVANARKIITLPDIPELFTASVAVIPMQLFAYYVSVLRGSTPDKPRNLAKSVTVE